jgi:hypothetical protein
MTESDIACYRVNYEQAAWDRAEAEKGFFCAPIGAVHAVNALCDEVERLRAAIIQTLNENGHLADGDNCTLIALKRAMPDWELPE